MSAGFVHLHVHTQYSLRDGSILIPEIIDQCKQYGMDSVATTDHGAMYGALEFYVMAKRFGINPIIGCEFYMAPGKLTEKKTEHFHIVLLAMNYTGYKNLMKMTTIAQFEGFFHKPRIDMETLVAHNKGLIALTACLKGQIPSLIRQHDMDSAREKAKEFQNIFGDRLYFELQENGIAEQTSVNNVMKQLASELGVKTVATNDCHYLNKEDAHVHDVLISIQTNCTLADSKRFKFPSDEFYFKSPAEMKKNFLHSPEAIANTVEIAERCKLEIEIGDYFFPIIPVSEGEMLESMFTKACENGLKERFSAMRNAGTLSPAMEKQYKARLNTEIKVINTMGFPGYFLIVADYVNWAKGQGIMVGPGRGTGGSSLAAYCMRITNIDPIAYGLLFERFLNIKRKSMPDFDVDFCQERRCEVIEYVRNKYGADHVAQILIYETMKAREAIGEVGRAMDIPFGEVDKIVKLIPEDFKMTIRKAVAEEPRLQDAANKDPKIDELLCVAQSLEGLPWQIYTHATGIVISPRPIVEFLPTCKGKNGEILTQYDMRHTEMTGLIKFDFLGLKTLTVIGKTLKHIKADIGTDLDIDDIPMDDLETFDLLCNGNVLGVFQLESSGMRDFLIKMAPTKFSDLIALLALYRPGPIELGMVNDFLEAKHGGRAITNYPLFQIKSVLDETYGVIVYQEQVMQIANIVANFSLSDADNLRRLVSLGPICYEAIDDNKEKIKFITGAKKNNIPEDKAEYLFELMVKFAQGGFNKSHAAAYALISYQTAYLKAHYPRQFMAALITCGRNKTDKRVIYLNACWKEQFRSPIIEE